MQRTTTLILSVLILILLAGCTSTGETSSTEAGESLLVSSGETQMSYTRADLEALASSQSVFNDVTYLGVSLPVLLAEAGYKPEAVKAVKAVASDGFTVNYDPQQFQREDVLVAYARADGPLASDDGTFRMVLPGEEGKLNVRMLVELQVIR